MAAEFLTGATNKTLIRMSIPISLGMISTILFQVVDTYFVGQLGGSELAALGFASTVYFLLVGLYIGLSVAVSIQIGRLSGEGAGSLAKDSAFMGLLLALVISSLFTVIGLLTLDPLFALLGAQAELMPHIRAYLVPIYLGLPLLAIGMAGGAVLRSTGYIRTPEVIFGLAGIINVVLDYVLIFGVGPFPELGIQGVAIGTGISWVFIVLVVIFYLIRNRLIRISFHSMAKQLGLLKEVIQLGIPTSITQLVGPLTLLFITFLLGRESAEAVAAFGVAGRIETLMMIGIMAVSTASTPFIAQNLGAKKQDRIDEAVLFAGKSAFYLGFVLMVIMLLFAGPLARLFSDDPTIILHTRYYFYIVSLSYTFYGFYQLTAAIFNGLQLPNRALRIVLLKTFLFTVPIGVAGSYFGVDGVFIGLALSNIAGGIYASRMMSAQLKKVNSNLLNRNMIQDYQNDFKAIVAGILSLMHRKGIEEK